MTAQGAGGLMGGTLRWRDTCGAGLRSAWELREALERVLTLA